MTPLSTARVEVAFGAADGDLLPLVEAISAFCRVHWPAQPPHGWELKAAKQRRLDEAISVVSGAEAKHAIAGPLYEITPTLGWGGRYNHGERLRAGDIVPPYDLSWAVANGTLQLISDVCSRPADAVDVVTSAGVTSYPGKSCCGPRLKELAEANHRDRQRLQGETEAQWRAYMRAGSITVPTPRKRRVRGPERSTEQFFQELEAVWYLCGQRIGLTPAQTDVAAEIGIARSTLTQYLTRLGISWAALPERWPLP